MDSLDVITRAKDLTSKLAVLQSKAQEIENSKKGLENELIEKFGTADLLELNEMKKALSDKFDSQVQEIKTILSQFENSQ